MDKEILAGFLLVYIMCGLGTLAYYDENNLPPKTKLQLLKNMAVFFFWPIFSIEMVAKRLYSYWTELPDE